NARDVSAGPCKACHEAALYRIDTDDKDDGSGWRRRLGGDHPWRTGCDDHSHPAPNQVGSQSLQPVVVGLCPAMFDRHVAAFEVAGFSKAAAKGILCGLA